MPLYRATTALGARPPRGARDALDGLDPAPLASEVHDHDDGSGLWDVGGLFDGRPDPAGLALLARLHAAPDFAVARVEDRDWVAQVRAELTPVEAGRFVVFGSHDRARGRAQPIGLEIEAAQAFGTGHHATTQGCLLALDRLVRRGLPPGASPTSAAAPACWRWRRRRSGRCGRSRATSIRWRRRRRGPMWRRTGSRTASPASRPPASATRGCGRGRPTIWSSPTSWPGR